MSPSRSGELPPSTVCPPSSRLPIVQRRSTPGHPLGGAIDTFVRREDAERFIEEVRGDDPKLASYLRIEERELEAGESELASVTHGPVLSRSTGGSGRVLPPGPILP